MEDCPTLDLVLTSEIMKSLSRKRAADDSGKMKSPLRAKKMRSSPKEYTEDALRRKCYTPLIVSVLQRLPAEKVVEIGETSGWASAADATDYEGRSAVWLAANSRQYGTMLALLRRGASPTGGWRWPNGWGVVHLLIRRSAVAVLRETLDTLRAAGRDTVALLRETDRNGRDALSLACHVGRMAVLDATKATAHMVAVIGVLVDFGIGPDERVTHTRGGWTALHLAARQGNVECVLGLLRIGASGDAVKEDGATPLYLAALNKCCDAARVLLRAGANPDRPGTAALDGKSPRDIAAEDADMRAVFASWPRSDPVAA